MTDIASVLSLSQCSVVWVFILSIIFLKEPVTYIKVVSIMACMGGGIIVGFSEGGPSASLPSSLTQSIIGDIFIVASTVAAAVYLVLYKKFLLNLPIGGIFLFLSFIGFTSTSLFWPLILIFNAVEYETFASPTLEILPWLLGRAFLMLGYNLLLNLTVMWTSPLFMRVVLMLTVPTSFIVDVVFIGTPFKWMKLVGAIFIVAGFLCFVLLGNVEICSPPRQTIDTLADSKFLKDDNSIHHINESDEIKPLLSIR
eukprot:TRINITY_DN6117_c0_g1_i1.p1 TRINITY_DN6117_c0_g1~~TRINITY_DN6117_c0_g1_i1.p1  ORF type:complete len:255 (-),score=35.69 TRINITY_DN6117_c0_g1_i1:108-872(-)